MNMCLKLSGCLVIGFLGLSSCGTGTGSAAPTTDSIITLVGSALARQDNAARWLDPAIGLGNKYLLKKLESVAVIGPIDIIENGAAAKARVSVSGSYLLTVEQGSQATVVASRVPPSGPGEAEKPPQRSALPAAATTNTTLSGEHNFRKAFTIYLGKNEQGVWDIR